MHPHLLRRWLLVQGVLGNVCNDAFESRNVARGRKLFNHLFLIDPSNSLLGSSLKRSAVSPKSWIEYTLCIYYAYMSR